MRRTSPEDSIYAVPASRAGMWLARVGANAGIRSSNNRMAAERSEARRTGSAHPGAPGDWHGAASTFRTTADYDDYLAGRRMSLVGHTIYGRPDATPEDVIAEEYRHDRNKGARRVGAVLAIAAAAVAFTASVAENGGHLSSNGAGVENVQMHDPATQHAHAAATIQRIVFEPLERVQA